MKFVLAPDSFKESLTAKEICQAMEEGIHTVFPQAQFIQMPMADGGEGTVDALVEATQGKFLYQEVQGPLAQERVQAKYGILANGQTAVIEMAEASGLDLVKSDHRNPLFTTTYGTGELILAALDQGVKEIIIGLGGSATNDGGAGMAQALGVKLLDKEGQDLAFGGGSLAELQRIDLSTIDPRIKDLKIRVACDVTNPLLGPEGATAVFGPQKGADSSMLEILENNLKHYASVIEKEVGIDIKDYPGAGAAGGLGAGLLAFSQAQLESGIDIIMETIGLPQAIQEAAYVFTGEGAIDYQSKFGKVPYGLARICKQYDRPLFVLAGSVGEGIDAYYQEGITAIFSVMQKPSNLETALNDAYDNVRKTSENIARILALKTRQ